METRAALADAGEQARQQILAVLPSRARDIARQRVLAEGGAPVVTVIGKYNHGKSCLLNELLGQAAFSVADKRETVALARRELDGVCWLDAPGIDADVASQDDLLALDAVWLHSDIRLFVHAVSEGELDAREREVLHTLLQDAPHSRRQVLLVLTRIDQSADDAQLQQVLDAIRAQLPEQPQHPVSSRRHQLGRERGKALMLERSGLPALKATLADAIVRIPDARRHEHAALFADIGQELRARLAHQQAEQTALEQTGAQQRRNFDQGLRELLARLGEQLQQVIDVPGPDHADCVDAPEDHYRQTPAKRERARIQVAYSRACIELDAFLVAHGVIGLPDAQRTGARAMDSVMVAVMGVSVKRRADLRRMFCDAEGAARLHADFAGYFETSDERVALAARIGQTTQDITATHAAMQALDLLAAQA